MASWLRDRVTIDLLGIGDGVRSAAAGRGQMVAAHLRHIGKSGRLPFEVDRGVVRGGPGALRDLVDQWRCGGGRIAERSERCEAFNIMLSMPPGTRPEIVRNAVREFAAAELGDHRFVMVLHTHRPTRMSSGGPRGGSGWASPQPAQAGPAALARGVHGKAARLGHRG